MTEKSNAELAAENAKKNMKAAKKRAKRNMSNAQRNIERHQGVITEARKLELEKKLEELADDPSVLEEAKEIAVKKTEEELTRDLTLTGRKELEIDTTTERPDQISLKEARGYDPTTFDPTKIRAADVMAKPVQSVLVRSWMKFGEHLNKSFLWCSMREAGHLCRAGLYGYVDKRDPRFQRVPENEFNYSTLIVRNPKHSRATIDDIEVLMWTSKEIALAHRQAEVDKFRQGERRAVEKSDKHYDIGMVDFDEMDGPSASAMEQGLVRSRDPRTGARITDEESIRG